MTILTVLAVLAFVKLEITLCQKEMEDRMINNQNGKVGWIILWALGIPIPILLVLFFLRGCT